MLIFKNSLIFLASIVSASDFLSKEVSNSDVQEFSGTQSDDRSPTKEFMKQSSESSSDSDPDSGSGSGSYSYSGSYSRSDSGSASGSSEYVDFDHDENLLVHSKVDEYLKMAEINKEEAVLKAKTEFNEIKKAFIEAEVNFQKTTDDSVEAYDNLNAIKKACEQRQNAMKKTIESAYNERTIENFQSLTAKLEEEEAKIVLESNTKLQEAEDKLKSLEIIDDEAEDVLILLEKDYKLISKVHRQFLLTLDYNDLVDKNQKLCEIKNIDSNEIIDRDISSYINSQNRIDYAHIKREVGMAEKLSKKIAKYTKIMSKKGKEIAVLKVDRDFKSVQNSLSQLEVNLLSRYGDYRLIDMKCEENGSVYAELESLEKTAESLKLNSKTAALDEKLTEIETVAIPKLVEILQKGLRDFKEAKFKVSKGESDYKSALENYIITFVARREFLKSLE